MSKGRKVEMSKCQNNHSPCVSNTMVSYGSCKNSNMFVFVSFLAKICRS